MAPHLASMMLGKGSDRLLTWPREVVVQEVVLDNLPNIPVYMRSNVPDTEVWNTLFPNQDCTLLKRNLRNLEIPAFLLSNALFQLVFSFPFEGYKKNCAVNNLADLSHQPV